MVGVELNYDCGNLVEKAQEKGVLINVANGNVIRFVPPLVITKEELDEVVEVIDEILPWLPFFFLNNFFLFISNGFSKEFRY